MNKNVIIELHGKLTIDEVQLLKSNNLSYNISKNIFGGGEVVEILCVAVPNLSALIAYIVVQRIKAKRYNKVKINGKKLEISAEIEIEGLSEKAIIKIVEELTK